MHMITRYHDISTGHRVHNHESKCAHLHGHNYRIHFQVTADFFSGELDNVGRVIDFSVIKERLCQWLEDNWDHKFLAWDQDPLMRELMPACGPPGSQPDPLWAMMAGSLVWVPFNPTAENMAEHLVKVVGPQQLEGTDVRLNSVKIEETRKCAAVYVAEA